MALLEPEPAAYPPPLFQLVPEPAAPPPPPVPLAVGHCKVDLLRFLRDQGLENQARAILAEWSQCQEDIDPAWFASWCSWLRDVGAGERKRLSYLGAIHIGEFRELRPALPGWIAKAKFVEPVTCEEYVDPGNRVYTQCFKCLMLYQSQEMTDRFADLTKQVTCGDFMEALLGSIWEMQTGDPPAFAAWASTRRRVARLIAQTTLVIDVLPDWMEFLDPATWAEAVDETRIALRNQMRAAILLEYFTGSRKS